MNSRARPSCGIVQNGVVARNIFANIAGRAWMMIMSFAFVPVYIHLLGVESYALIGFFATLMVVFSVLDLGLSASLNRELARRSALEHERGGMRDVVRTLEAIYWAIGLAIGVGVFFAAPAIAHDWLKRGSIPLPDVEACLRLMGLALAFQWPTGLYGGGLQGLQRQVRSNLIDIAVATLRGVGAILVLLVVNRSLFAYFLWQVAVCAVGVFAMRVLLWRSLPAIDRRPRIDRAILGTMWTFAMGMTGVSILSVILMQADKVLLSTLLPLASYAHYILGSAVASAAAFLVVPISNAFYPRLTQLVALHDRARLLSTYRQGCALVAVAIIPLVVTVALFSNEIVFAWTGDKGLALQCAPIASLLVLGTGFNALMFMPYMLQLSNGSTRLTLSVNLVSVVALVPLVYVLATRYGAFGAAFVWPLLNGLQLFVVVPLIHRRFLPGVTPHWLSHDVALPVMATATLACLGRMSIAADLPRVPGLLAAGAVGMIALAATAFAIPEIRRPILARGGFPVGPIQPSV